MFKILLITQDTLLFSDLISRYNKNNIQMTILGKVYDRNIYDITEQHFVSILFFSEGFGLLSETVKQLIQTEFTCPLFELYTKNPILPPYKANSYALNYFINNSQDILKPHLTTKRKDTGITPVSRKRVLLIEDDFISYKVIKSILDPVYYDISWVKDGKLALELIYKKGFTYLFDIILLDFEMPHMNGLEFLTILRRIDRYKNIPVLVTTSKPQKELVVKMGQHNIVSYILKPYEKELFLSRIESCLLGDPT